MSLKQIIKIANYYNLKYNFEKLSSVQVRQFNEQELIKKIKKALGNPNYFFYRKDNLERIFKFREKFQYWKEIKIFLILNKDEYGITLDTENKDSKFEEAAMRELMLPFTLEVTKLLDSNLPGLKLPENFDKDSIEIYLGDLPIMSQEQSKIKTVKA